MAGVNDDGAESNPFERPDPSEPFSITDAVICVYVSRGKVTFKDLLFVTRNGDGSHIDDGILEVLQLEMHTVKPVGLLSVARILFFSTERQVFSSMKFKFCFHLSKMVQSTQLTSLWMFAALYQHRVAISIAQELRWTITTSIFLA